MSTGLSISLFGRCQRKEGAGVDAEPVLVVVPVVWASCSSTTSSEGSGDVSGERGPTSCQKWSSSPRASR